MIRLILILLLCLTTPLAAQDEKKSTGKKSKPAATAKEKPAAKEAKTSDAAADEKKADDKKEKKLDTGMLAGALKFRSIGPAFMSGRIGDIAIDQKNPNTWYVAVASGGVWKTTNAGTTFKTNLRQPKIVLHWLRYDRSFC